MLQMEFSTATRVYMITTSLQISSEKVLLLQILKFKLFWLIWQHLK